MHLLLAKNNVPEVCSCSGTVRTELRIARRAYLFPFQRYFGGSHWVEMRAVRQSTLHHFWWVLEAPFTSSRRR
eukprot:744849-Amphidinium_carterae.2